MILDFRVVDRISCLSNTYVDIAFSLYDIATEVYENNNNNNNNNNNIGMAFGIKRRSTLIMRSVKSNLTVGIGISNEEKIRTLGEKETFKYWASQNRYNPLI